MSAVNFYHLTRTPLEKTLPRLLEKVLAGGMRAVVMCDSDARLEALDAHLWTYDQGSFLPHGRERDGDPADQPIYLTRKEENPNGAGVLVVTDGIEATHLDQFQRCLDLFDGNDEAAVAAARDRWRRLREAGHEVTYWAQNAGGGWERKG